MKGFFQMALMFAGLHVVMAADAVRLESIRKLASESYAERVEATRALWEQGARAKEDLQNAARSRDPEVAMRARDLLRKIDLGIEPGTDPRIIRLTDRYRSANQTQKNTIFHELRRLRAWRQILRLYANETDRSIRQSLMRMVDGIALLAARERLVADDPDGALEYLRMAGETPGVNMSIAAFHRSHGSLMREIEAVVEPESREDFLWLAALYRAADDPASASRFARKAGNEQLAAGMDMLSGDPLPWLDHTAEISERSSEMSGARYARAAAARWRGESARAEINAVRRQLRENDDSSRQYAIAHLFLLGDTERAWQAFIHHYPEEAFASFDALERVDDALAVLGLDPAAPDFKSYITRILSQVSRAPARPLEDDEVRELQVAKLVTICNFLEKRGKAAVLDEWVMPALVEFAGKHQPRFLDLMSELFGLPLARNGAPEFSMRVAEKWAGDNKQRWNEMMIAAFGEEHGYAVWWDLVHKVKPDADDAERLRAMLAIFGYTRDAEGLYEPWLDAVWKHLEENEDKALGRTALEFLTTSIHDLELSFRFARGEVWNEQAAEDDESVFGNLVVDAAMGRWNDVAELLLQQIDVLAGRGEGRAELHAYASVSLRNAGRDEEADFHESRVEALALGDPRTNLSIAQAFSFGRDYGRATLWYRRALMESGFVDNQFTQQVLRAYVNELMERREFDLAASCGEVLAQMDSMHTNFGLSPAVLTRQRQQADAARALAMPAERASEAQELLRAAHAIMPTDGGLADHFFPALLESPYRELHDELFEISWGKVTSSLDRFPDADNTMNTAVWFASRSARRLDEAMVMQRRALELHPRSAAYLDTLAEVYFAMGNREQAVRYGELAMRFMPNDSMIIRQYERFLHGAMPTP